MTEKIKSAAIMADGHIFTGDRHDLIFRKMSDFGVERLIAIRGKQGFITTLNRFVDRVEALEIATRENQIISKYRPLDQLLSEDMRLWEI
jgi:hypothetical protein